MAETTDADAVLATDAGSWLVWQPEAFAHIQDYETWSEELEEASDLQRHVTAGAAVPITIGSDGAYSFRMRVGQKVDLTERERRYLLVSSGAYLLVSKGRAVLSGIEHVGAHDPIRHRAVDVPPGRWAVTAHVIAWDDEPGATDKAGRPTAHALPDFVVLLEAEERPRTYSRSLTPFDKV